jgi:hypothetical protein
MRNVEAPPARRLNGRRKALLGANLEGQDAVLTQVWPDGRVPQMFAGFAGRIGAGCLFAFMPIDGHVYFIPIGSELK